MSPAKDACMAVMHEAEDTECGSTRRGEHICQWSTVHGKNRRMNHLREKQKRKRQSPLVS